MQGQHILPVPPVNNDGTISKSVLNQMWRLLRNFCSQNQDDLIEYKKNAILLGINSYKTVKPDVSDTVFQMYEYEKSGIVLDYNTDEEIFERNFDRSLFYFSNNPTDSIFNKSNNSNSPDYILKNNIEDFPRDAVCNYAFALGGHYSQVNRNFDNISIKGNYTKKEILLTRRITVDTTDMNLGDIIHITKYYDDEDNEYECDVYSLINPYISTSFIYYPLLFDYLNMSYIDFELLDNLDDEADFEDYSLDTDFTKITIADTDDIKVNDILVFDFSTAIIVKEILSSTEFLVKNVGSEGTFAIRFPILSYQIFSKRGISIPNEAVAKIVFQDDEKYQAILWDRSEKELALIDADFKAYRDYNTPAKIDYLENMIISGTNCTVSTDWEYYRIKCENSGSVGVFVLDYPKHSESALLYELDGEVITVYESDNTSELPNGNYTLTVTSPSYFTLSGITSITTRTTFKISNSSMPKNYYLKLDVALEKD